MHNILYIERNQTYNKKKKNITYVAYIYMLLVIYCAWLPYMRDARKHSFFVQKYINMARRRK